MDSAELYMTLIRPSMVPILGEAWTFPFNLQIELATWGWKLTNADELRNAEKFNSKFTNRKSSLAEAEKARSAGDLMRQLNQKEAEFAVDDDFASAMDSALKETDPKEKDRQLKLLRDETVYKNKARAKKADLFEKNLRKQLGEMSREERDAAERAKQRERETQGLKDRIADATAENFQFRFSKRVDFASTQMLNSMKQGDVFPTGIITVFQRAPNLNHAASLILTVQKLRLLDYKLRCEVTDTMTDMREDWTAEFYSLGYVYKSRGMIKDESGAQLVTAAITQGTPRVFAMSMKGTLPI
jgi:hypothetical protein